MVPKEKVATGNPLGTFGDDLTVIVQYSIVKMAW